MPAVIGRDLRKFAAFRLGGLNVKDSPQTLASDPRYRKYLTLARHVAYPKSGGVSKRLDTATYNTTTLGATVGITGGFQLKRSNGDTFIIGGTGDGRIVLFNSDGTTTNLASGLTTSRRWSFATYNDLGICVNGADAPRKTTGTAAGTSALGGSPPSTAQFVFTHGNRVLMVTVNSTTLTWSALNNEEDYTTASNAGSVEVSDSDGGNLLWGISAVSEALLGKENGIFRLQSTSPSTYAITNVVPARTSLGGVSFQAVTFGANDIWYGTRHGFQSLRRSQQFGDLTEKFPSRAIDPYFELNTDFTVSLNRLGASVMVYSPQDDRIYYGVDTNNDNQNDTLFVYDVATGGISVWPGVSCASLFIVNNGTNGDEVFMGGYDGFLRRLNVSASTNAINARFNHISDLGLPYWAKRLRRLFIYVTEEGNFTLQITTNYDFGASGGQTYTISLLGDSATLGSTFTLGTSTLGSRSQLVKELSVNGTGEFVELGFANAQAGQPFTVMGYEAMFRPVRQINRGT